MRPIIQRYIVVAVLLTCGVLLPRTAHADGFITPFFGVNFSGSTDTTLSDATSDNSKLTYGVALGIMGGGVIGLEEDISYAPKFFAPGVTVGQTNVLTAMTNLIIGIPFGGQHGGGVRPYASGGIGLLRTNVERSIESLTNLDENHLAFDFGGGINAYFSDHVGMRGDLRYFSNFSSSDPNSAIGLVIGREKLDFWRGTVGIVFRF